MDAFGTLLAIKFPHGKGQLDRRMVPLADVFEQLFLLEEQTWPPSGYVPTQKILETPWVFFSNQDQKMVRHPMPPFANGVAGTQP